MLVQKKNIAESLSNINQFSALLASLAKEDNQTIHNILTNANSTLLSTKKMMMNADKAMLNANETISQFAKMSKEITNTSKEFKRTALNINQDLPEIMARINEVTKYLNNVSATLDSKLPTAMDKFVRLGDNLNKTIENNNSSLNKALTSVDGFFSEGTETMEKIDKFLDASLRSELHLELRADKVYDDGGYSKSHLNITLKPDPTRFYMIGLTSKPSFEANDGFSRGYVGNKLHESGDFLFSAQYGKRYDDLLFRIGIIDSQGGFGIDYFALNDTLKLSTEVSDFNAVNDIRGKNPNLTATVRYQFFKHINAYIAGNNLMNSKANSISMGVGVSFVDNDLKTLMGTAAAVAGGN